MKTKNRVIKSLLGLLLAVVFCTLCLSACRVIDDCAHEYGEWYTKTAATCTEAGVSERKCTKCPETETEPIAALGHDWNEATCTSSKTCKVCATTEGDPLAHTYTVETVQDEALKTAATCTEAAVYYKSCACGAISTNAADTFVSGVALDHKDENRDHTCDRECGKNDMGTHADAATDSDHTCDYGCGAELEACVDSETDTDHNCDVCGKADVSQHAYGNATCGAPATCTVCGVTTGDPLTHKDENHDHVCDHNCGKNDMGTHADVATDKDHLCDYGCGAVLEGCSDVDTDTDHSCDVCGKADVSQHKYGNATCTAAATCSVCGATTGDPLTHKDENYDHACDYNCGKKDMGDHADAANDKDHLCDYGCGAELEACVDSENDNDHSCDICGKADVSEHKYGNATCTTPATCSECGMTTGEALAHKDSDFDHVCDYNCGKNDMGDHADAANDKDHLCDYGCGAVLESCSDVDTDADHKCDACGKDDVTAHEYKVTGSTPATCVAAATKTYTCNCGDSYTENDGDALGHDVAGATPTEVFVEGCQYVLVYKCQRNGCGADVTGENVYHHTHVATITKSATCKDDGVKTLTCACGDSYTVAIEKDATGHNWEKGTVNDGTRTDTCSHCGETKSVTVYTGTQTDSTNASDLKDKEIELNDANINLGSDVLDQIGDQNITVSADKLEGDDRTDLGLTEDQLAQVGDSPIYNFTINNGSENISQFGENNYVTITLPYTLAEGEDVDSIAVWFINDKGELESIKATYNNGYVTFKTNHFSYYTVTRLTPAERCALYGHGYSVQHVVGDCTKDSYDLYVCVRCYHKYIDEETYVVADGHDYVTTTQPATCVQSGYVQYACRDCDHSYKTTLAATGHNYVAKATVPASCTADGYTTYACEHCGDEYVVIAAKLAHEYDQTVTPVSCTSAGYTTYACKHCAYTYTDSYVSATGHQYKVVESVAATCTTGGYTKYSCETCDAEYTVTTAKGAHEYTDTVTPATCTSVGYTTHACKLCTYSYVDGYVSMLDHSYKAKTTVPATCTADGYTKYGCENCAAEYTATIAKLAHEYNETVTPATCTTAGYTTYACKTCTYTYTDAYVSAKGHSYAGAVWTWATDNTTATLTMTCTNDAQHVITLNANVQVTVTKGTCSNFTRTVWAATATYNGTVYNDEKVVEEGTPEHVYSTTWKKNDTEHWYECVCGEKKDLGAHVYANATVTKAPTCSTAGESVATCVCGATQKTELPATGEHDYQNGICTGCGAAFVNSYYINLVNSWNRVNGFSVKIQNLSYEIKNLDTATGAPELEGYIKQLDIAELALYVEDGKLGGAATGKISIFNGPVENAEAICDFKAVIHEDFVYVSLSQDNETAYIKLALDAVLANILSEMPVDEEGIVALEFVYEKVLPIVDAFIKTNSEAANQILEDAFNMIFTFEKQADGSYLATLDYAKLRALNENLATKNVAQVVDLYFGEGAFDALVETATEILGLKLSEIPAYLDAHGLDSDALIAVINELAAMSGAPEDYDIGEMLTMPEYAEFTVGMLLFETEDASYVEEFNKAVSYLKVISLYELIDPEMAADMQEGIAAIIDMVAESLTISFTTTADGMLTTVAVDLDDFAYEMQGMQMTASLNLVLEINGRINVTWSDLIEKIEQETVLPTDDMLEDEVDAYYNYGYAGSFQYQGTYYYYEDGVRIGAYNTDYSKLSYLLYQADCAGWTCYEASYWETEYMFTLAQVNIEGETMMVMIDENSGRAVLLMPNGDDLIALYEDGTQKTFTESMFEGYEDMAKMYAALALAIFEDAEGVKCPGGSVYYYYNATTKEYATESAHDHHETYVINGTCCEDGGRTVTITCTKCNYSYSYTTRWCETEEVEIDLSDKVACGAVLYAHRCIYCETVESVSRSHFSCDFELENETTVRDEFGNFIRSEYTYVCNNCGTKKVESNWIEQQENCRVVYHNQLGIYVNDECVYEYDNMTYSVNHQYEHSYEPFGNSCEDGYRVYVSCTACDYSYRYESYGHTTTHREINLGEYGLCGGYIREYVCEICHEVTDSYVQDYECDWYFMEELDDGTEVYTCRQCGVTKRYYSYYSTPDANCQYYCTERLEYYAADGSLLYSFETTSRHTEHDYEYSYDRFGETCEDGYYVYMYCKRCGVSEQGKGSGHDTEWREIDLGELGLCGGHAEIRCCRICNQMLYADIYSDKCTWVYVEGDDTYERYVCRRCGAERVTTIANVTQDGCWSEYDRVTVYYVGGIEVLTMKNRYSREQHEYVYDYVLHGKSCEDGVTCYTTCKNCDYYDEWTYYHHNSLGENVDLSEKYGICYGWYNNERCLCGEISRVGIETCCQKFTENSYYDENGHLVRVQVGTCTDCGLRYSHSWYTENASGSCETVIHHTYLLTLDDVVIFTTENDLVKTSHKYTTYAVLLGGEGTTCADGVLIVSECARCGHSTSYETYDHEVYAKETIDLSKYGNVCGGTATLWDCACGRNAKMEIDTLCDHYGEEHMVSWVTNALTGGQVGIGDYFYFDNYALVCVCAVTDPAERACGFAYAYATYWLREEGTCYAQQYQTWLFGYDRETGTYKYEITFQLGNRQAYHDYEDLSTSDYDTKLVCKMCDSSYYQTYTFDNDGNQIRYERGYYNTLEGFYIRSFDHVEEYATDATTGMHYLSRDYTRYVYADGTEYWVEDIRKPYNGPFGESGWEITGSAGDQHGPNEEHGYAYVYYKGYEYTIYDYTNKQGDFYRADYTYSFEKGCYRTVHYQNSYGPGEIYTEPCCQYEHGGTIQAPTCTQDGLGGSMCPVCGTQKETYPIEANGHSWQRVSNDWYVCDRCGLENANGASGDIVMEDLTDAYGNGVNYVVGYYTWSYVDFGWYVSLILPTGEEIIVEGVKFIELEGLRAIAFGKAEVEEWAAKMGYTDYDVRFSFVPVGADGSFDYGLTFAERKTDTSLNVITNRVSFQDFVDQGERKVYTIVPNKGGMWIFTTMTDYDTYGILTDENGNVLAENDNKDWDGDFKIYTNLEAGRTYYLTVYWNDAGYADNMILVFTPEIGYGPEGGEPDDGGDEELAVRIEEALGYIEATWEALAKEGNGDNTTILRKYNKQYQSIRANLLAAESWEILDQSLAEFEMIVEQIRNHIYSNPCQHETHYTQEVPSTCTQNGYKKEYCNDCGVLLYSEYYDALGHAFDESGACVNCGYAQGEIDEALLAKINDAITYAKEKWESLYQYENSATVIAKYENQYQRYLEAISTSDSYETLDSNLKRFDTMIQKMLDMLGVENPDACAHTDTYYNEITAPTCSMNGYGEIICRQCNEVLYNQYTAALAHQLDENGACVNCGYVLGEIDKELLVQINDAITYAKEKWESLYQYENSAEIIARYEKQYYTYLDNIGNSDSYESLEKNLQRFESLMQKIMDQLTTVTPPTSCEHASTYTNQVSATCTQSGYKEDICNDCGAVLYRESWAALGHSFDEKDTCVNCGYVYGEEPDAGKIYYLFEMEMDGMQLRYEFYENGTVFATRTNPQTGETMTDTANWKMNDKNIVDIVYDGKVVMQFTVNADGYTLTLMESSPEGECLHRSTITGGREATCTEEGYKETICNNCGEVLSRESYAPFGHSFDEQGICMNCGASEGETGEATDAELSKRIEEAVSTAQRVWGELADMGVSRSVLKTYQAQYDLIVESMQNADSFESLEKCQQQFDEMIAKITATL